MGAGDEVITVANTFVATVEAIVHCGARPVLVDIDPATCLIDLAGIERAVTSRTKAIVPVHLYGAPAPLQEIMEIAGRHGLAVVEDAAQAHGAALDGRRTGTWGRAAAFSFYPGKNLGALGDGGAVVTADPELHEKMKLLRNHGSARKYYYDLVGYNYRMDTLTGALLGIKLPHLERWTENRRRRVALYRELLAGSEARPLEEPAGSHHVYHLFVVRVPGRDRVMKFLAGRGVQTNIHYPLPVHQQKGYAWLGYGSGAFPESEKASAEILSLPLCAHIKEAEVEYVCEQLKLALKETGH